MNEAQRVIAGLLEPATMQKLGVILKDITGATVQVQSDERQVILTGTKDMVMKARAFMDRVTGLRLDRMDDDGHGLIRAIFVLTAIPQPAPGVV